MRQENWWKVEKRQQSIHVGISEMQTPLFIQKKMTSLKTWSLVAAFKLYFGNRGAWAEKSFISRHTESHQVVSQSAKHKPSQYFKQVHIIEAIHLRLWTPPVRVRRVHWCSRKRIRTAERAGPDTSPHSETTNPCWQNTSFSHQQRGKKS